MTAEGHRAYGRAYYLKNREKVLAAARIYQSENKDKIAAYLRIYNAENKDERDAKRRKRLAIVRVFVDAAKAGGCVDCGEKDLVVLDLDHVRGKKVGNISAMLAGPLPRLLAEIDKCEPRCANCHRRVTAQRWMTA